MLRKNLNGATRVAQPVIRADTITILGLAIESFCTHTLQTLDHTNEHEILEPPKGCLSREEIFRLNLHSTVSVLESSYPPTRLSWLLTYNGQILWLNKVDITHLEQSVAKIPMLILHFIIHHRWSEGGENYAWFPCCGDDRDQLLENMILIYVLKVW